MELASNHWRNDMAMTPEEIDLIRPGDWIVSESNEVYKFLMRKRKGPLMIVLVHLGNVTQFIPERQQCRADWPESALEFMTPFDRYRQERRTT